MNNYMLGLYEKSMPNYLTLEDKLNITKSSGFDYLEISIDESDEKLKRLKWSRFERDNILKLISETGTKIISMCLSGHRRYPLGSEDNAGREKSIEIMKDAIDLANDLGIRIIQIAGYDEYYEPSTKNTKKFFEESLQICVDYASMRGVILAFETMETDFMNTIQKAIYYVNKINSPYLQVYPDIGNVTNASITTMQSPVVDIKTGSGHIAAVHLKETIPGKFREIPFGKGHVDFKNAFKHFINMGVHLYVAEFWYNGEDTWMTQLKEANTFLRGEMR